MVIDIWLIEISWNLMMVKIGGGRRENNHDGLDGDDGEDAEDGDDWE